MIRTDEKIAARLGAHKVFVFAQQKFNGYAVALLRLPHNLFIRHIGKAGGQGAFPLAVQIKAVAALLGRFFLPAPLQLVLQIAFILAVGHEVLTCL